VVDEIEGIIRALEQIMDANLRGQESLCIACLEARIGRTLMGCDFTDAPVNDICDGSYRSDRCLIASRARLS